MLNLENASSIIVPSLHNNWLTRESLTRRLLAVAAGFIVLTEAIVFLPSIATFRQEWLIERFDTGELAVLADRAAPTQIFARGNTQELLRAADIIAVTTGALPNKQVLIGKQPVTAPFLIDLERQTFGGAIFDALQKDGWIDRRSIAR